jgi:hypothetical protein
MATSGIDFFRVDRSTATRRLLAIAGVLVGLGAIPIGAHLVHRLDEHLGHVLSLVGGALVLIGLILGFGAMAMMIFEDVYVLLREDAVVLHNNGKETTIPWADLASVSVHQHRGFLTFERVEGAPVRWFVGDSAEALCPRIETARLRALHGLFHVRT